MFYRIQINPKSKTHDLVGYDSKSPLAKELVRHPFASRELAWQAYRQVMQSKGKMV